MNQQDFLYPRHPYHGQWTPKTLVFNANLQEFSTRVGYICGLEGNGKLSSHEAYQEIKSLWKKLKRSKQQLDLDVPNWGN